MTIDEFQRATADVAGSTLFLLPNGYHYIPITVITTNNNQVILSQSPNQHSAVTLQEFLTACKLLPATTKIYFQGVNQKPQLMYGFKKIPNAIVPN